MTLKKIEWWDQYKVADDSTDIRGWKLLDRKGHDIGEITDLIFDTESCRARYAVTDIATKQVLLPIGMLALDEGKKEAVAPDLTIEDIEGLENYSGESELTEEAEQRYFRAFHPGVGPQGQADYRGERFENVPVRVRRIEERLRIHYVPGEPSFTASEPEQEEPRA